MYANLAAWVVLTVYAITFAVVAILFQWIDWEKIVKKEGKKYSTAIYFLMTAIATYCVGSLILTIANLSYM